MPDPSPPHSRTPDSKTLDDLAERPQVASDDGGRGIGPTLGADPVIADQQADKAARQTLKAQMVNIHKPPPDGDARGGPTPLEAKSIVPDLATLGPKPTPGAAVPPATTDLQNSDD